MLVTSELFPPLCHQEERQDPSRAPLWNPASDSHVATASHPLLLMCSGSGDTVANSLQMCIQPDQELKEGLTVEPQRAGWRPLSRPPGPLLGGRWVSFPRGWGHGVITQLRGVCF